MSQQNPYEAPCATFETPPAQYLDAPKVASGQKLVVYACGIYMLAGAFQSSIGPAILLLGLAALVMALIGVVQVMSGLAWSAAAKVPVFVLMFIPVINLIALLVVNSRATAALRKAGYQVGLFGASK